MPKKLLIFDALAFCSASLGSAQQAREPALVPPGAQAIIAKLHMENIPHEGPWFVQTHKSEDVVEGAPAARYAGKRSAYTAIYTVLTADDFSAMHRLATDEIWHFYAGSPARMLLLYPDGRGEIRIWGGNVAAGEEPQILVPRGTWMGAQPIGKRQVAYSFGGTTMSPGFEYADYEPGDRAALTAKYPRYARVIAEMTRVGAPLPPSGQTAPVTITALVGRDAPQVSDKVSTALFVMQPDASIPMMRTREGHEVMIVTAGEGIVTVGDKAQAIAQGSVVYLPPQVPHSIQARTRLEFYVAAAPAWRQSDTEIVGD